MVCKITREITYVYTSKEQDADANDHTYLMCVNYKQAVIVARVVIFIRGNETIMQIVTCDDERIAEVADTGHGHKGTDDVQGNYTFNLTKEKQPARL